MRHEPNHTMTSRMASLFSAMLMAILVLGVSVGSTPTARAQLVQHDSSQIQPFTQWATVTLRSSKSSAIQKERHDSGNDLEHGLTACRLNSFGHQGTDAQAIVSDFTAHTCYGIPQARAPPVQ
ncbi:hypothetical protein [Bowmanella yangjiangensis]|uniref:Uncharacterized protein n=1 Tax=Bowmanella yangjiangensis TaxID=2811230 RepID=A0ABS3CQ67_9ALTE|nr:hypothetical protein [Bowmanella yangjiangensis]MBN7818684.1 hypothetical protein [Bowmanella yangjiangensis]